MILPEPGDAAATPIARRPGVSELAVTVLGVSILFSLPELTVSGFAIASGNTKPSIDSAFTGYMEPLLSAEVVYDSAEACA